MNKQRNNILLILGLIVITNTTLKRSLEMREVASISLFFKGQIVKQAKACPCLNHFVRGKSANQTDWHAPASSSVKCRGISSIVDYRRAESAQSDQRFLEVNKKGGGWAFYVYPFFENNPERKYLVCSRFSLNAFPSFSCDTLSENGESPEKRRASTYLLHARRLKDASHLVNLPEDYLFCVAINIGFRLFKRSFVKRFQ